MFCQHHWKVGAGVLIVAFFATIAWCFSLLEDLEREVKREKSGHPFHGVFTANMTNPADVRLRAALVNVAGMTRGETGQPSRFVSAGSGVIVTANGYVATGWHVVQNLKEIVVRLQTPEGPRQYPAQLVKAVPQHDLAVIKIVSRDLFPYAPLERGKPGIRTGETLTVWGDPHGVAPLVRQGGVVQVETQLVVEGSLRTHLIQTSAPSHWSLSGGPMVNAGGSVVGINVVLEAPNGLVMGYAVPTHVLLAHFQDVVPFPVLQQTRTPAAAAVAPAPAAAAVAPAAVPAALVRTAPAPVEAGRPPRPADAWWAKAAQMFGQGQGEPNTPSAPLGIFAATRGALSPGATSLVDGAHQGEGWRFLGHDAKILTGLLLLGLVSGMSGGMMTMGGGIIKVSGLILFFGYGMLLIRPVAYLTNIFLYGAAALRYRRYGLIRWSHTRRLIPWAMLGVVLGYFLGNVMGSRMLHYLLGVFAALVGGKMVLEIIDAHGWAPRGWEHWFSTRDPPERGAVQTPFNNGLLGLSMGVVSGILGITGGVVEVPLQRYLAGVPLRNAIANSAVLVFFASLAGAVVALLHGVQSGAFDWRAPLHLALILIPGAYVGGLFGAWMTRIAPIGLLRWLYAVLMFAIAVRMFWI
ncbi:MAG: TSUP family transporter [Magnetococcales bacterium]|nr:TSUP family transporter [Magnetococcales bacterium]